jgi:2-keto-4-pentenoate hydratase
MTATIFAQDPLSTPTHHALETAALLLANRRGNGLIGPRLTNTARPTDFDSAFALQQQMAATLAQPVIGWKCLLPTAEKQIVAPMFGHELSEFPATSCALYPSPLVASLGLARVEPELALLLQQDLPPRTLPYTETEIDAAIGSTHLALELIQSRFAQGSDASFLEQLADGLFNQGLYLGPAIEPALLCTPGSDSAFDLELHLADGTLINKAAVHPNQNARAGLYWLVNFLSARGIGLSAGQVVITGSYAGVLDLPFAQNIRFQYGHLGQFELRFVAK